MFDCIEIVWNHDFRLMAPDDNLGSAQIGYDRRYSFRYRINSSMFDGFVCLIMFVWCYLAGNDDPGFSLKMLMFDTFPIYKWSIWLFIEASVNILVVSWNDAAERNDSVDEIIAQIEKLAILKEKGIISEKDYEKKKKDLLKRI